MPTRIQRPRPPVPAAASRRRAMAGFTLIELVVTVAVAAIFAAVAAPPMQRLIAAQRVRSASSALVESLWFARSAALQRNTDVGLLFTDAASGWTVKAGTASVLQQPGFAAITSTQTHAGGAVQFTYNAFGRLSSGAGWVQIGLPSASTFRCITVSSSGKASAAAGKCSGGT